MAAHNADSVFAAAVAAVVRTLALPQDVAAGRTGDVPRVLAGRHLEVHHRIDLVVVVVQSKVRMERDTLSSRRQPAGLTSWDL